MNFGATYLSFCAVHLNFGAMYLNFGAVYLNFGAVYLNFGPKSKNRVFSKGVGGGRYVPQNLREVSSSVSGKNILPTPCKGDFLFFLVTRTTPPVCKQSDWDILLGLPERARAETGHG